MPEYGTLELWIMVSGIQYRDHKTDAEVKLESIQRNVIEGLRQGKSAKYLRHLSGLSVDEWNEIAPEEAQIRA